jgi:predicted nucleic acid-binding Zn ribbon protein
VTTTRRSRPTRLGEVLAGYLKSAGLAERVGQARLIDEWAALVGERIARSAAPESVTPDGTLFVRVKSSAWRQELSLMTPEVLALINANRVAGRIKRIRWLVGTETPEDAMRGRRGRIRR